ncbi:MAG: hypothetical protein JWQ35_2795 [Bacteriovoracaceae bacterium]|nr:hypothetical protein [Bacteriovoracaceae bacterium]
MAQMARQKDQRSNRSECIEYCLHCHALCVETISHCLQKGGEHAESNHVRLLEDCAEICQTAANFLLRSSKFYPRTCEVCAEISEKCAESCEKMADDQMLKACAELCRKCAESCRSMAS